MDDSELETELDLLRSIYFEELDIGEKEKDGSRVLVMRLRPQTGMNEDEVFVRTDLRVTLPPKYPDELPSIELFNMRGLGDEDVAVFMREMGTVAEENKGCPMLYQMFELGKEYLNQLNQAPRGECVVCLEGFSCGDFMKTPCYHHLHVPCFSSYVRSEALDDKDDNVLVKKEERRPSEPVFYPSEVPCPVCRAPVPTKGYTTQHTERERLAREKQFTYVPDRHMVAQQQWMQRLYEQQVQAGGIIDVQRERQRFHLDSSTPVYVDSGKPAAESDPSSPAPSPSNAPADASQPPNAPTASISSTNVNNTTQAKKHNAERRTQTHSHSHRGGRHHAGSGGGESSRQHGERNGHDRKNERTSGEHARAHTRGRGRAAEGEKRGDTNSNTTSGTHSSAKGNDASGVAKGNVQVQAGERNQEGGKAKSEMEKQIGETTEERVGDVRGVQQDSARGGEKGGNERNSRGRGRGRGTQDRNGNRSLGGGHAFETPSAAQPANNTTSTNADAKSTPITNELSQRENARANTTQASAGVSGVQGVVNGGIGGKTEAVSRRVEDGSGGGRGRGSGLVRGRGRARGRGRGGAGTGGEDKPSGV